MEMSDEEWVKVATGDDAMVAELLLMFKQVKPTAVISKKALSVEWKVRQRRSKAVTVQSKKQAPPRASPTTPLSWSGATSVSGGGGGCGGGGGDGDGGEGSGGGGGGGFDGFPEEESSRPSLTPHPPKRSETPRSKVRITLSMQSHETHSLSLHRLLHLRVSSMFPFLSPVLSG